MSGWSTALLSIAAAMAALGQVLFRVGARGRIDVLAFINWQIISGFFLYGTATLVWVYVLSREQLVDVYAFTALTFALVYLAAVMFLGERLQMQAGAGIGFVLVGLFLIARAGH